jgi:glucose/arabinose dehydrogenase
MIRKAGGAFSAHFSNVQHAVAPAALPAPTFTGKDAQRRRIDVQLTPVASGLTSPVDVQFPPNQTGLMAVVEQKGKIKWIDQATGASGVFLEMNIRAGGEQGLLGMAFHPDYARNGKLYVNIATSENGRAVNKVEEWSVPPGSDLRTARATKVQTLIEVADPYSNHNAGQLQFGPDGFLYIGYGDGGSGGDPQGNGQNLRAMLGKMVRIDVDHPEGGKPYGIPDDNPFVGRSDALPEIYAYGFRNPWRYSFNDEGQLIVADVGQNAFEEIDIVEKGKNYGWNMREGRHFYGRGGTMTADMRDPVFEYGRDDGSTITGGYVSTSDASPALKDKYIFADFGSGRLWALDLPDSVSADQPLLDAYALGKWRLNASSFGRDTKGNVYVADLSGTIYKITA